MGYKSRGNYQVNCCLRQCANKDYLCDTCFKWSNFIPESEGRSQVNAVSDIKIDSPATRIDSTPEYVVNKQGEHINLGSRQKNEMYRLARNLKDEIKDKLCTKDECRNPTDKNVKKMLHSEFASERKIIEFKNRMKAIGADPRDYNVERLRK